MPIGDAKFWLIGRDPARDTSGAAPTEPYFGLVDEGSKLNLNYASTNMLAYLPNMTADFAQAIVDWSGTNGSGDYTMNYAQLGYEEKEAPFETVDELRLVYGATVDLIAGDDLNRNGVLDANETDTTGTGQLNSGLFEYTTVWTREPNFHSDGSSLTNVNTCQSSRRFAGVFAERGVGNAAAIAQIFLPTLAAAAQVAVVAAAAVVVAAAAAAAPHAPIFWILPSAARRIGMSEADFAKIYTISPPLTPPTLHISTGA